MGVGGSKGLVGVGDWDWRMCCKTVLQNAGNCFRAQLKIFIIEKKRPRRFGLRSNTLDGVSMPYCMQ